MGNTTGSTKKSTSKGTSNYITLPSNKSNEITKQEEKVDLSGLSNKARFFYNQLINNAGILSESKVKMMIDKQENISSSEKDLIRKSLGV